MLALLTVVVLPLLVHGLSHSEVSFALESEYTLSNNYNAGDAQHVFDVLGSSPSKTQYTIRARPTTVYRPTSNDIYQAARLRSLHHMESQSVDWQPVEMLGPDIDDQHTLGQLARMTGNAYASPGRKSWYDLDEAWNTVRASPPFHSQV